MAARMYIEQSDNPILFMLLKYEVWPVVMTGYLWCVFSLVDP